MPELLRGGCPRARHTSIIFLVAAPPAPTCSNRQGYRGTTWPTGGSIGRPQVDRGLRLAEVPTSGRGDDLCALTLFPKATDWTHARVQFMVSGLRGGHSSFTRSAGPGGGLQSQVARRSRRLHHHPHHHHHSSSPNKIFQAKSLITSKLHRPKKKKMDSLNNFFSPFRTFCHLLS